MLPFAGGQSISVAAVVDQLRAAMARHIVEGITLLGGEPIAHAEGAAALAQAAQQLSLTVMVFSGYNLRQIRRMPEPAVHDLLANTDILVDGPFVRELLETRRRWIGSTNQRIHFLTDRYRADDPCWRRPNTLEVRLVGREVVVNGFPAANAAGLWRRQGR
jgi:anaerobic ribonucleoside-triphosphate reductase activating protein